jgi:DNA polymerase-3 subunit delta
LAELIGAEAGALASDVEKLAMYVGERPQISADDVRELVGLSREEKIFAVMDAALLGRTDEALRLWRQVLATDPAGVYKALGGMAFVVRRLLGAHRMVAEGASLATVAPKVMMFRREAELRQELSRNPALRLETLLAEMAELDKRAKLGLRSLELGIESLLVGIARPAA